MASGIEMSHIFMQANAARVETLVKALQGVPHAPPHRKLAAFPRPSRVNRRPDKIIDKWLSDFDVLVRQCGVPGERAVVLFDYLGGVRRRKCYLHVTRMRFIGTS